MKRALNSLILVAGGVWIGGLIWLTASPPRGEPVALLPAPTPGPITVHVSGAVADPGVYQLPRGARVADAVEAAGGVDPASGSPDINLAKTLEDGVRVDVVLVGPAGENPVGQAEDGVPDPAHDAGLVDINTATQEQLEGLPGIGPAIAGRIIDYRAEHGPFEKIADIVKVSGIGPATFDTIKDLITVTD